MADKQRYTPKRVAEALKNNRGRIFLAAEELGCCASTIHNYINRYPSVAAIKDHLHGKRVDGTEDKLHEAVEKGEPWAIQFTLKTQGKDRGYGEVNAAELDRLIERELERILGKRQEGIPQKTSDIADPSDDGGISPR